MKKGKWIVTLSVVFLCMSALALAQMPHGQAEQEDEEEEFFTMPPAGMGSMMMGGGRGRMGMMGGMQAGRGGMRMHAMPRFFAMVQEEVGLSDEQVTALEQVRIQALKEDIQRRASIAIAELELQELLAAKSVDLAQAEVKVREIEKLRADKRILDIQLHEKARGILTPEQQQKMRAFERRMMRGMGPGMQGMHPGMMPGAGSPMRGMRGPKSQ